MILSGAPQTNSLASPPGQNKSRCQGLWANARCHPFPFSPKPRISSVAMRQNRRSPKMGFGLSSGFKKRLSPRQKKRAAVASKQKPARAPRKVHPRSIQAAVDLRPDVADLHPSPTARPPRRPRGPGQGRQGRQGSDCTWRKDGTARGSKTAPKVTSFQFSAPKVISPPPLSVGYGLSGGLPEG